MAGVGKMLTQEVTEEVSDLSELPAYTSLLKQYDIPDDPKARMRLLANLIIDRYLKDKAEGKLKTFN